MGTIGEHTGMAADESQKQKRGDRRSKEWGQAWSFHVIDGSLSSQEFELEVQYQKYKGRVVLEVTLSKMIQDHTHIVFTEPRTSSITDDSRKSHGHYSPTYLGGAHKRLIRLPSPLPLSPPNTSPPSLSLPNHPNSHLSHTLVSVGSLSLPTLETTIFAFQNLWFFTKIDQLLLNIC